MNAADEFERYLRLYGSADERRDSPEDAATQMLQEQLQRLGDVLREPDPAPDLALIRRIQAQLEAAPARAAVAPRKQLWSLSAAAALVAVWLLVDAWWPPAPEMAASRVVSSLRASSIRDHLLGQAQLLTLVVHAPDQVRLRRELAVTLLQSQAAVCAAAERGNDRALLRHCRQMDPVLRLLATTERALSPALIDTLADADLAFRARALASTPKYSNSEHRS